MWLVLCDASDTSGLWVHQELRARGVAPLELITADALSMADYWEHRIAGERASIRFRVDNLDIAGEQLRGVVNRLYTVPIPHWRSAEQRDRDYVQQELIALFLSWLHALPCPVVKAGPLGLPYLGGVYLRALPTMASAVARRTAGRGRLLWIYCHPYDFDPAEPFWVVPEAGRMGSRLLWYNRRRTFAKVAAALDGRVGPPLRERIGALHELPVVPSNGDAA